MDAAEADAILARLAGAFGAVENRTPGDDQPLHVLLAALELPEPWTPSPARALTIWQGWPAARPRFVLDERVVGETDAPPRSSELVYLLGEGWREFSFSFPWSGDDPVHAIQRWLTRFVSERS